MTDAATRQHEVVRVNRPTEKGGQKGSLSGDTGGPGVLNCQV